MRAQQTLTVQNKPAAVAPKETITSIISSFLELGRRKLSMQPKFVAAKMLLKQKPSKHSCKWIAGFITLGIYTRWKRVCIAHTLWLSCPSIWATLSALLINILLGSFQLFLHSDQPLSEGEELQPQKVSASRVALSTPEAVVASRTDWQTALMRNRRRPAQHHHVEHHFQL